MSFDPTKFSEHHIPRGEGRVYARDYAGAGPAFVLMHGFPDNLHIWDDLIPYLVASGRRFVTFDFLGFGASDKPSGATYSFKQQLGDLEAVVEAWEDRSGRPRFFRDGDAQLRAHPPCRRQLRDHAQLGL